MNQPLVSRATVAHPGWGGAIATHRVLRNTYALLSMTLLFSASVAAASAALRLPSPGVLLTLAGYFGLLFLLHKVQDSGWAVPAVFALTGFMGYTLGPVLGAQLALPGGAQTIALALAATGATFLALSAWVLATRRDFSFMGGFLFAGMVIAILAGLGAMFFQLPALALAVSAMVALLSAGLICSRPAGSSTAARPTTSWRPWACSFPVQPVQQPAEPVRLRRRQRLSERSFR